MNEKVIDWLLEEKEPSIRYRTLTELLEYPSDCEEVMSAKEKAFDCENVRRIFSRTDEKGIFPHKAEYYGNWTTFCYLTALAELGITKEDKRVWPIVDWILTPGEDKLERFVQKEFAPAYLLEEDNLGGCRQIRFLSTLVRLGYLDDPRVKRMIDVFAEKGRFDGGYLCKWKKSRHKGQEPKSCYIAAVPALYLYSVLPACYRQGKNYDALIDYFISREIIYSKTEPGKIICDTRLGFFSTGYTQILTVANAMGKLGLGDTPQMRSVWEIIQNKTVDGKYILETEETKRTILMDRVGKPNKWITFQVLLAQKEAGRLSNGNPQKRVMNE